MSFSGFLFTTYARGVVHGAPFCLERNEATKAVRMSQNEVELANDCKTLVKLNQCFASVCDQ